MINIWQIIDFLNTKTSVTDLVWNRIYYWLPETTPDENYITVNIISNSKPRSVEEKTRIEFTAIWWDTSKTFSELQNITNVVYNELLTYNEQWVFNIVESTTYNNYDVNNRKVFIQDLVFYRSL